MTASPALDPRVARPIGEAAETPSWPTGSWAQLRKAQPQPAMLVLGDMSIQGNIKEARSLMESLQVAMGNGAKRALIPIENKRSFMEVSSDVLENIDPIFYGDLQSAGFKALGLN